VFTGLIKAVGRVEGIRVSSDGGALEIRCNDRRDWGECGASVAVNGVCLTLREQHGAVMMFDVLAETFNRTNLKHKVRGSLVNLEAALKLGDPLGGHWVSGHVDGVGHVQHIRRVGRDREVTIACDPSLTAQMVVKGSICCDGVSLTLVDVRNDAFCVHIIPHTWEHTAWRNMGAGDAVNIETDILGKYVARYLGKMADGESGSTGAITWNRLREAGFDL
jgi:riboflavin synthase